MASRRSREAVESYTGIRKSADFGILALRLGVGGLLAGHGVQKISNAFGGHGLEATAGWFESMGLKPGRTWAIMAAASELGGGLLTALGLAWPVGPLSVHGAMATATRKVHWGRPIWVTAGGAELPVLYGVTALGLQLIGPGRYSLDRVLNVRIPISLRLLTAAGVVAGIIVADMQTPAESADQATTEAADSGEAATGEVTTDGTAAESVPAESAPPTEGTFSI